jgi:hypothetical protein
MRLYGLITDPRMLPLDALAPCDEDELRRMRTLRHSQLTRR